MSLNLTWNTLCLASISGGDNEEKKNRNFYFHFCLLGLTSCDYFVMKYNYSFY